MFATIEKACVLNGAQAHGYESTFAEVSGYSASAGASQLYSESYVRDNLGRITQRTEVLQGATTMWGYTYDLAGRLSAVTRNGAAFESYTYDLNDNRLTKATTSGTTTCAYDDQDRLVSSSGPVGVRNWVHDANGDLVSLTDSTGTTSFNYDTSGQLLSVTKPGGQVVSYEFDAGNTRAVKRVNGEVQRKWLYTGGLLPAAELDANDNVVAVFNGGFMVKQGTVYRLLRDHLGSVRLVVDAGTGTIVQRLSYGPWGEVLEDTNPGFQPFGYAGGLYDQDTGLVRFGARDYDAGLGRFLSRDAVDSRNRYEYAYSNPVNSVDRNGLRADVTVEGNNVNIVIPIEFYGQRGNDVNPDVNADPRRSVIDQYKYDIEKTYTGQFGEYNVTTTVKVLNKRDSSGKYIIGRAPVNNDEECPDNGINRVLIYGKDVKNRSYSSFKGGLSTWRSDTVFFSTTSGPHEAGHLMGLNLIEDGYDYDTFEPKPGYVGNVMAGSPNRGVTGAQIAEIIRMNP